jgi:uncharacterized protein (DUF2147 family)
MRRHIAALMTLALPICCLAEYPAQAQSQPQEPSATGLWQQADSDTGKKRGWFVIAEHNGTYEGTIVKMFMEPGEDANPLCDKCTGDQQNQPWLGLTIIKGMARKGLDYENGKILDPTTGKLWSAEMHLSPDGRDLTVRGFLGFSLLGMNQYWKRLPDSEYHQIEPTVIARLPQTAIPASMVPKAPQQKAQPKAKQQ